MRRSDIVVAGGGPAGLATALACARAGARVTLVERDRVERLRSAEEAFAAPRGGIPHYQSPHAFLPRGVKLLRSQLPDVYAALLACGATEHRPASRLPDHDPLDDELVYLGVRRPVIEWALREAVLAEPLVAVEAARVAGLIVAGSGRPRVAGIATDAGELRAELVVDAMGRTSRVPRWLAEVGIEIDEESSEVGVVYYSRYFRLRPGADFPPCSHPLGPRGELGFATYTTFFGDNRTFAVALIIPTWEHELKAVREPTRHQAFCRLMPEVRDWVDPGVSEPVTGVLPMGALRTIWRGYESRRVPGLVAVADAYCHTDPSFALGLSLGLIHGLSLARLCARHGVGDAAEPYWEQTSPELRERFELARDVSAVRLARMRGEQPQPTETATTFATLAACARLDPGVFRAAFRRIGFLDRLDPLDETVRGRLATLEPPPPPPTPVSRRQAIAAIGLA